MGGGGKDSVEIRQNMALFFVRSIFAGTTFSNGVGGYWGAGEEYSCAGEEYSSSGEKYLGAGDKYSSVGEKYLGAGEKYSGSGEK